VLICEKHVPNVSIAIPAYNCEQYIAQSIESLLGQTYGDFELVISDNASTDGTQDVCRRYESMDSRVRYARRSENIGGPGNFRYVFSLCSGKYHKWSTADDFWHPNFLQEAVDVLDRDAEVVLCYPKTQLIDSTGARISDYDDNLDLTDDSPRLRFRALYQRIGLCNAHLGLLRRDVMLGTRLIAGHKASDIDFLAEMALRGRFHLLPDIRFFRRFHPASSSWERGDEQHQKSYYDPADRVNLGVDTWRRFGFQFRMVSDAPIGWFDKLALYKDLGRGLRHKRDVLWREFWGQLRAGEAR
jgi:glycosyltransferase involved in cell wall biosynthesis